MNGLELVALIGGGALGAGARYVIDGLLMRGRREAFPVGIVVVNVTGSFLLGLLTALALDNAGLADVKTVLGTGLLGGYTTFSSFSFEVIGLFRQDRWLAALAYVGMSVGLGLAACYVGMKVARVIVR